MRKIGMMRQVGAMIAFAFVALVISAGVSLTVWLERISRHASARGGAALDISKTRLL